MSPTGDHDIQQTRGYLWPRVCVVCDDRDNSSILLEVAVATGSNAGLCAGP
ncbi:MAG: hypothetical protein QGF67_14680 [Lentisphaeria bacterium]|nr:hypothetical protein [Lentisphaeria bacterium]MDP7742684.1 hypothetical protein [Lentisphaeria bacterium]